MRRRQRIAAACGRIRAHRRGGTRGYVRFSAGIEVAQGASPTLMPTPIATDRPPIPFAPPLIAHAEIAEVVATL